MINVVNEDGNLRVHNRAGYTISVFFEDEAGAPRDMTDVAVSFLTEIVTIPLGQGEAVNEKVLVIMPQAFAARLNKRLEFLVRDESLSEKPPVWTGNLIVRGW